MLLLLLLLLLLLCVCVMVVGAISSHTSYKHKRTHIHT